MPCSLILRGLHQRADDPGVRRAEGAEPLTAFKELLAAADFPAKEPVITWDKGDVEHLAALDLDWHGAERPEPADVELWFRYAGVYPPLYWVTHGRGVRAIFGAEGIFTADEGAALYYVALRRYGFGRFRVPGFEVKTATRHPLYPRGADTCGPIHRGFGLDVAELGKSLLGQRTDVDPEAVEGWLSENGFTRGKAYEHDRCPIEPGYASHGSPVYVGDAGIFCHSCNARGGSGFVPYASLIEGERVRRRRNRLADAARGLCHFEHARHILADAAELGLEGQAAELVYRALLKLAHRERLADEKRGEATRALIGRVFYPKVSIVRGDGDWVQASDLATLCNKDALQRRLRQLPALYYVTDDGETKLDDGKLGEFLDNGDLSEAGYPAIHPLRGVDLRDASKIPDGPVMGVVPAVPPFQYRRKADRDAAWVGEYLNEQFPGVRLDVLKLLIAGKGIAQLNPPEPPRVMIVGQSGSAKTAHVALAAELACDSVHKVDFTANLERMKQAVAAASRNATFVFIDEISKAGQKSQELLRAILSITREGSYHQLYRGNRKLPPLGVLCMADTVLADGMAEEIQLARRVVLVDIGAGAVDFDWRESCLTGDIAGWRGHRDFPENVKAADTLVSEVAHAFAGMPFERIAEALGFPLLSKQTVEGADPNAAKRALFDAVCRADEVQDATWKGRGWRVFEPMGQQTELVRVFLDAIGSPADPLNPANWQRVKGAQWGKLLGRPGVELDLDRHGRKVGIRFRLGKPRSPATRFNGEILTGEGGGCRDSGAAAAVAAEQSVTPV